MKTASLGGRHRMEWFTYSGPGCLEARPQEEKVVLHGNCGSSLVGRGLGGRALVRRALGATMLGGGLDDRDLGRLGLGGLLGSHRDCSALEVCG